MWRGADVTRVQTETLRRFVNMTKRRVATHNPPKLLPSQKQAADKIAAALKRHQVSYLYGATGLGRSTVLRHLAKSEGGAVLNAADFLKGWKARDAAAIEEAFYQCVLDAMTGDGPVFVDDANLFEDTLSCSHFYPRGNWLHAPLHALATLAKAQDSRLVFVFNRSVPGPIRNTGLHVNLERLAAEDYAALAMSALGGADARAIDFGRVHRFASRLNLYDLAGAFDWLRAHPPRTTEGMLRYLEQMRLSGNVDVGEVRNVELSELIGADDVIEALTVHLLTPFENLELAQRLDLKPRRGVLLLGPPGCGKTTIGRALARRMSSKFFLIDGSMIAGTDHFFHRLASLVELAKENAPSIIFIDDSDVLFEDRSETGLYRYLLTILDGLESETAGRVCVMMTAMDVAGLPPALIRSGRIELWLELKLPDAKAREAIMAREMARLPENLRAKDFAGLVKATEGFSGADLRRLAEDAKALFASDAVQGKPAADGLAYFMRAIETVTSNRARYEEAQSKAKAVRAARSEE